VEFGTGERGAFVTDGDKQRRLKRRTDQGDSTDQGRMATEKKMTGKNSGGGTRKKKDLVQQQRRRGKGKVFLDVGRSLPWGPFPKGAECKENIDHRTTGTLKLQGSGTRALFSKNK